MRNWPERKRSRARIEIIPMIDVMMFLLVFFVLISIHVLPALGLRLNLPHSATAAALDQSRHVTVTVTADQKLFLDQDPVTPEQLTQRLQQLAAGGPHLAVTIAGDQNAVLQQLVSVLDAVKRAGVSSVAVVARPRAP